MAVPLPHGVDRRLLALLATDEPRPGSLLARSLDTAESEIDNGIEQLRSLGIDVIGSPKGFRLGLGGRLELVREELVDGEVGETPFGARLVQTLHEDSSRPQDSTR